MRVLGINQPGVIHARHYLAVRLAMLQFFAFGALVLSVELLPGGNHDHRTTALVCAAIAFVYVGVQAVLPASRSLMWLFGAGMALYITLACVAIASTGGTHSPLRLVLIFSVVYGASFFELRSALWILAAAIAATLLPTLYGHGNAASKDIGFTVVLSIVLLLAGALLMLGRAELNRLRVAARREANRDPLTNIANRRALIRELDRHTSGRGEAERLGLVFIDLDAFKQINSVHGHAGGDAALCAVAAALDHCARSTDLVARVGGDEFAIVAPGVSPDAAQDLAQRAIAAIESASPPELIAGLGTLTQASAGVALWPRDGADTDSLLRAADLALFAAKNAGKGRVVSCHETLSAAPLAQLATH
ncbi:MAG TPA: GGDEF domain-containing protein [Solirubrobacteraceae bacterium]|jgi:diguanylate cyclase (GGDEF)-like protein